MAEYIEKEVAVDLIDHELRCGATADQCGLETAFELLCGLPPADVRPVARGQWIMRGGKFRCSRCDSKALWSREDGTNGFSHEYTQKKSEFCPNCGADLREVN